MFRQVTIAHRVNIDAIKYEVTIAHRVNIDAVTST